MTSLETLRRCRSCDIEQALDQFPFHDGYRTGNCRTCRAKRRRAYREALSWSVRERALDVMAAWGLGLRRDEIEAQRAKQDGKCAICSVHLVRGRGLTGQNVDHDHTSFTPRGLICKECNRRLGLFEEVQGYPPEYVAKLVKYLADPPWQFNRVQDVDLVRQRTRHRSKVRRDVSARGFLDKIDESGLASDDPTACGV